VPEDQVQLRGITTPSATRSRGRTSLPEEEPYDRRLSTSREQRVRQLLSHEEIGDRKPSLFVQYLKALAPDVPDDFLRTSGPAGSQRTSRPYSLANQRAAWTLPRNWQADFAPQPLTASVTPAPPTPDNKALLERIEELSRQVAALRATPNRGRSKSREHHRRPDRSSSASHDIRWYHRSFGDKAQKSIFPCSRSQGNTNSGR
jgi:hypothetical protein